jgi:hypothetical protein
MLFCTNIDLSRFSQTFFCHNQNNNHNYYIPFDREFHGLQNGIQNIKKKLTNQIKRSLKSTNQIFQSSEFSQSDEYTLWVPFNQIFPTQKCSQSGKFTL